MTNGKTIITFGGASSHGISEGISHKRLMPFCFSGNRIKVTISKYLNNSMCEKNVINLRNENDDLHNENATVVI